LFRNRFLFLVGKFGTINSMITSAQNPKIQQVRALLARRAEREQQGVFVVEGVRLFEEACASGWPIQQVFYAQGLSPRGQQLLAQVRAQGVPVEELTADLLTRLSDTEHSSGILAVIAQQPLPWPQTPSFLLIADGLRDPGNLGTLLRSAAAAGVQGVLLAPGTTDPFAPKVLRAGMGAHFRLPMRMCTWAEVQTFCHPSDGPQLTIFLADALRGDSCWRANLRTPLALVVGAEAQGLSAEALACADAFLSIPMPGQAESLNAAVAAGILLFEVVRQRSQ
jgi:TrmH family RNA methyltransferase